MELGKWFVAENAKNVINKWGGRGFSHMTLPVLPTSSGARAEEVGTGCNIAYITVT